MKRSVSSWNCCLAIFLKVPRVAVLLALAPLCMSSAAALAAEGRLSFGGHISNASCALLQPTGSAQETMAQRVNVSADLSIIVDTTRNACAGAVIPFSAHYQPLVASRSTSPGSGAGVLTLTYQ